VLAAEVVRDEKTGPAVLIVIAPHRRKTEAIVILVETDLIGDLYEPAVAVISKEHVGRSVQRIMVRRWRTGFVLAHADVIAVRAQIQIQEAVTVVVGHRRRRQRSLQRLLEMEGVGIASEAPLAVIQEQQGPASGPQETHMVTNGA